MLTNRTYRLVQSSDLVKVSSGELKAFFCYNSGYFPAKLASTRMPPLQGVSPTLWVVEKEDHDDYIRGNGYIFIDVTPEKRYAIWNHKKQRFLESLSDEAIRTADKTAMEVRVQEYCTKYGFSNKDYYIVEWEIKNDV